MVGSHQHYVMRSSVVHQSLTTSLDTRWAKETTKNFSLAKVIESVEL